MYRNLTNWVVYEPKEKYSLGYLSNNVYIFLKPSTLGYVVIFFKPLLLNNYFKCSDENKQTKIEITDNIQRKITGVAA